MTTIATLEALEAVPIGETLTVRDIDREAKEFERVAEGLRDSATNVVLPLDYFTRSVTNRAVRSGAFTVERYGIYHSGSYYNIPLDTNPEGNWNCLRFHTNETPMGNRWNDRPFLERATLLDGSAEARLGVALRGVVTALREAHARGRAEAITEVAEGGPASGAPLEAAMEADPGSTNVALDRVLSWIGTTDYDTAAEELEQHLADGGIDLPNKTINAEVRVDIEKELAVPGRAAGVTGEVKWRETIQVPKQGRGCVCENVTQEDVIAVLGEGFTTENIEDWEVQGCDSPAC